jgi:hypothetical protein
MWAINDFEKKTFTHLDTTNLETALEKVVELYPLREYRIVLTSSIPLTINIYDTFFIKKYATLQKAIDE